MPTISMFYGLIVRMLFMDTSRSKGVSREYVRDDE